MTYPKKTPAQIHILIKIVDIGTTPDKNRFFLNLNNKKNKNVQAPVAGKRQTIPGEGGGDKGGDGAFKTFLG